MVELIAAYSPPMPGAGEKAKQREGPEIPRQGGGGGRGQINRERDEKEFLAAEPVGQPAEEQRAEHRAGKIRAADNADVGVGELQRRACFQRARQRAGERDFEAVENPGDAERHHDEGVKPAPGQAVEPRGDVGFDDGAVQNAVSRGNARDNGRHGREGSAPSNPIVKQPSSGPLSLVACPDGEPLPLRLGMLRRPRCGKPRELSDSFFDFAPTGAVLLKRRSRLGSQKREQSAVRRTGCLPLRRTGAGLAKPARLTALHCGVFNPWCPTSYPDRLIASGKLRDIDPGPHNGPGGCPSKDSRDHD